MVSAVPVKPIVLANFYLDTGTLHYSGAGITFKGVPFFTRIITAGSIERSIPLPSGQLQIPDAQITLADTDGGLKALVDNTTPIRRLVEIIPELASHKDDATPNNPLFIGEILDYHCPPGEITFSLRSITAAWLGRPLLHLINKDNFPNIPDDVTSGFAPIIFGRVYSYSTTNVEAQGAIQCIHVDTVNNDFVVARHACYAIPAVYRKRPLDSRFTLVDPSEYTTPVVNYTLGGVLYHFQMIRFISQQYDGTIVQCDVSGSYSKYNWEGDAQVDSVEVRNPSDCLWNLIYLQLQNETAIERFDSDSFIEVRNRCSDRGYFCDGAITGKVNSLDVITCGSAISKLCESFNIDFLQTSLGLIKIQLYDLTIDAPLSPTIDGDLVLERTFTPSAPINIYNHILYKYHRDNAGLPDGVRAKGNKEYAFEYSIRNVTDQTELAATGSNPDLRQDVEFAFVRDDDTALDVAKKRIPYHALRSYDVTFSIPAWTGGIFAGIGMDIGKSFNLTSIWGIGPIGDGFVSTLSRIKSVTVDLREWELLCKATIYWPTTDGDLDIEFTGHAAHAAQTRKPQFPVTVNGATAVTAPKGINLNATFPAAPLGYTNIIFQEDSTTEPRSVSAYYTATGGVSGVTIYYGTLEDPDTRPTGLTLADVAKVLFYSTDFDHMYIWNGVDWTCIDYNAGIVSWHIFAPVTPGWVLCDGSGTVSITDPHGDVTPGFAVPNLTGGSYIKGGSSYSGSNIAANAPGLTGSTGNESATHQHGYTPFGSVTGDLPAHHHETDTDTNTGEALAHLPLEGTPWVPSGDVSGTMSGTTGESDISHTHGFSGFGFSGGADGSVNIDQIDPSNTAASSGHSHNFTVSGSTDDSGGSHSHDAGSIAFTGTFTDTSGSHYHSVSHQLSGPVAGTVPLTLVFTGSTLGTDLNTTDHTHTAGTLAVDATAEPKHMVMLPYLRL